MMKLMHCGHFFHTFKRMEIIDETTGLPQPTNQEVSGAVLTHLASFASLIVPFGNILGPLIVWLIKKDESNFVDVHGKESLNFQITYTLIMLILVGMGVGFAVSSGLSGFESGIALSVILSVLLIIMYWIFGLVMVIIAAVKANQKEYFRYPVSIRFIQ